MTEHTGRCLCGQVSYKLTAEPVASRVCWCRDCQYLSSNGTVNAIVPTEAIEISGNIGEHTKNADSGNEVRRRFCPQCGSHLFSDSSGRPGLTVVRVGTLDDPSSIKPGSNIWSISAPTWACLDPSLERFDRQAPPLQPPAGKPELARAA
jgi:hypothetical protein